MSTTPHHEDEIRTYAMAPALPFDPDVTVPVERRVRFVPGPSPSASGSGDVVDHQDGSGDGGTGTGTATTNSFGNEVLVLELDADERRLLDALRSAAHAWDDGGDDGDSDGSKLRASARDGGGGSETADPKGADGVGCGSRRRTQVRVAGGWVRDKILGLQTHDVDVALDGCTGVEFAVALKAYVEVAGGGAAAAAVGKIGVIAANPAQSKHLETATMRIFGIEVDFSNLRQESYAEDSRIPDAAMGTPLEDAFRRDFTINSLFLNLDTSRVEDWTRRGLHDLLVTKVVHTPLEAYQTFHDDPLRVLRAIRFAVRYQMSLSDDVVQACRHIQIHTELQRKVSRERVGKELEGMLSGKHADPLEALDLICHLKLAGSVFCLPAPNVPMLGTIGQAHSEQVPYRGADEDGLSLLRERAWEEARECVRLLPKIMDILQINSLNGVSSIAGSSGNITPMDTRLVYIATVLLPYERMQYMEKPARIKSVVEYMMREGIKFKNKDVISVGSLVQGLDDMVQLLQRRPEATSTTRLQSGLLLRATKDMWVTTLVVATVSLMRRIPASGRSGDEEDLDWCQRARAWYHTIVNDMKLDECWSSKPLMNGQGLIQFLGLDKGPEVGVYTQEQLRWMLMNPHGTIGELQVFLKSFQKAREFEEDQAAQHISKKMHL